MSDDDRRNEAIYEIRIDGHLGSRWTAWFDGLSVTAEDDGTTVIRGPVVDQSALHGVLCKLRDVGIPLLSLTRVPFDRSREGTDMSTTTAPMTPMRKTALVAGILYLVTFVTSIPVTFWLYKDLIHEPNFVLGAGNAGGVPLGAFLEVLLGLAGIGTAVVLYPVLKRYSERAALGFVTARVLESAMIFSGILSVLTLLTVRQDLAGTAGADSGSLLTVGHALSSFHDWTFLLGPGVIPAVNALLFGTVMYKSRLVPRIIPTMGLIGAPLLVLSSSLTLFGVYDQTSAWAALAALPIAAWELSVGVWMAVKGFNETGAEASPVPAVEDRPVLQGATA